MRIFMCIQCYRLTHSAWRSDARSAIGVAPVEPYCRRPVSTLLGGTDGSVFIAKWITLLTLMLAVPSAAEEAVKAEKLKEDPSKVEHLPPVQAANLSDASLGILTLAELEQMALAHHPTLAKAAARVEAARGNWTQVGLPPNPTLGYEGQQIGSGGLAEQHGVIFGQNIARFKKLRLNRAVASHEIDQARHEATVAEFRLMTDVRVAFHEAYVAQRQVELTDELVRIASKGMDIADALLKAKEVSRRDVVQAKVEIETARILADNALHRHQAAWRALAAVVANPSLVAVPLAPEAAIDGNDFAFEAAWEELRQSSPEIAAAMASIERARCALQRARVEPLPDVNVEALVNWQDNGIGGKADGGIAVSFPIPAWNRNQGAVCKALHEVVVAEQALSQLELALQYRLAPVYERYQNAKSQARRYESEILPAAKESLELTRKLYESGEVGYVDLLTAQRTFSQHNLNFLQAQRDMRISEAIIDGMLLTESLLAE